MKNLYFTFMMLVCPIINAQTVLSDSAIIELKDEIIKDSEVPRQNLNKNDENIFYVDKNIEIDFKVDTFIIEKCLSKRMSIDCTTVGNLRTAFDTEAEYDKLLNKYYALLSSKLDDTDKETLKQTQRNWIQFRDSERILIKKISKEKYSGGGTIQDVIIAFNYSNITKKRVLEIYEYLTRVL